jgi:hypothetical protein
MAGNGGEGGEGGDKGGAGTAGAGEATGAAAGGDNGAGNANDGGTGGASQAGEAGKADGTAGTGTAGADPGTGGQATGNEGGKAGDGKAGEGTAAPGETGKPAATGEAGKGEEKKDGEQPVDWSKVPGLPPDAIERAILALPTDQQEKAREYAKTRPTLTDFLLAGISFQAKITEATEKVKGMVKIPGKDATPEEKAAFEKALGVPETPDAYKITRPEGFEATPLDTAFETEVKKEAKLAGMNQAQIDAMVKLDQRRDAMVADAIKSQIAVASERAQNELREAWGVHKYQPMVELCNREWQSWATPFFGSKDAAKAFLDIRDPMTGLAMGENPGFLKMIADRALQNQDGGAFLEGASADTETLQKRHDDIKAKIGTDAYTNDLAAELGRLAAALERKKGKAA